MTTKSDMAENAIYADLIKVQAEIPTIAKNSKAVYGNYANFDDIVKIVRPILNKYNFALMQKTVTQTGEGLTSIGIITQLIHISGKDITSDPFIVPLQAERGKSLAQTAGSILTYAKRYSLCALLGISTGDDLDGNYQNQQIPSVNPKLEAQARQCASQGLQVYQAFYSSLSKADKIALVNSGLHNELKSTLN